MMSNVFSLEDITLHCSKMALRCTGHSGQGFSTGAAVVLSGEDTMNCHGWVITSSSSWLWYQCEGLIVHQNHSQPEDPQCHGSAMFKKEQQPLWREQDGRDDAGDMAEDTLLEGNAP